ncbi:MAG: fibronectin type III domain-containing protein [Alistipes sp.]|nr:fibronectin type III domain-containing protein [Alistipes sp.]
MKNLFKNLMFVAVAAMAFTACEQADVDVKEPVAVGSNVSFVFNVDLEEDTRVQFGEKSGDKYPIKWNQDETFYFLSDIVDQSGNTSTDIAFESKMTTFTDDTKVALQYEFTYPYIEGVGGWMVSIAPNSVVKAYPRTSAIGPYSGKINDYFDIQTPTENSVDSDYFAVCAEFQVDENGVPALTGTFRHLTAYSRITLPSSMADVEFDKVSIVVTDDESNERTYDLNVAGLNTHSYWFACHPAEVRNILVTAIAGDNVYTYEKALAADVLTFTAGEISPFTISSLEKAADYYVVGRVYSSTNYELSVKATKDDSTLLYLDLYTVSSDMLPQGQYRFNTGSGNYIGQWSYGVGYDYLSDATLTVVYLDKGYKIDVTFTTSGGVNGTYSYSGYINGSGSEFLNPGDPVRVATPVIAEPTVTTNSIVLDWNDIEHATGYDVKVEYMENWMWQTAFSGSVTESTCTVDGLKAFTEYNVTVVATTTEEGYRESKEATTTVTTAADVSAFEDKVTDEVAFTHMRKLTEADDVYLSAAYLFTTEEMTGKPTEDDEFMILAFSNSVDLTKSGVYTIDDLDYSWCYIWLPDNILPGWAGYTNNYGLSGFQNYKPYHFYPNTGDTYYVNVDVVDGETNITVYANNASWWEGIYFKGTWNGTIN